MKVKRTLVLALTLANLAILPLCMHPELQAGSDPPIRRRALLVGVTRYENAGWNNLKFPAKDARDLAGVLRSKDRGGW